jgi:3-methyladenine DNA glycosylase AlkD
MRATPTLSKKLQANANPKKAKVLAGFFKTGPGQYGEGDLFLGITMPEIRKLVRAYGPTISKPQHRALLNSPYHEERMAGLLIWVEASKRASEATQKQIALQYLAHQKSVNNWDLVDVTTPDILGPLLYRDDPEIKKAYHSLIRAPGLWQRRIALLATFYSIRKNRFDWVIHACTQVLEAEEDLIHKASGWMLREAGKRDVQVLHNFLQQHASKMPRTMLRYAIERLPLSERKRWMG